MGLNLSVHVSLRTGVGRELQFNSDAHKTLKIGRVETAHVCLDDPKVARVHAVIEMTPLEVVLIDMGSTCGSLVNGKKINRTKLQSGDVLLLGDTQITVRVTASAAPEAATVPPADAAAAVFGGASQLAATQPDATLNAAAAAAFAKTVLATGADLADVGSGAPSPATAGVDAAVERRLSQVRLRAASVEAQPHPALFAEDALSRDNRVLELRLYWGEVLLKMNHYTRPKCVTIGENVGADVFLSSDGLPTEQFPLIRYLNDEYVLSFSQKMQGEVEMVGQTRNLTELMAQAGQPGGVTRETDLEGCFSLALPNDARVLLHWSGASFALRFVSPPKLMPVPFGKDIDLQFINSSIFSVFSHMALIVMLAVYPHNTDALKVDLFSAPDRFANLILEAPKETKSTRDMLEKIKKQVEEKKEERKQVEDKKTDVLKQAVKMPANLSAPRQTVEDKKQEMTKRFSKLLGGGAGSLLGGGGGGSLSGALQNVIGTAGEASASAGLAGLGIRGAGPLTGGGMGTSRGLAGIGTSGRLGGGGANYGGGVGLGRGKAHNLVDLDTPSVEGALSADVIKRVINENKNQIRYCYEVELQHHQNLEGRVQMHWIISATGDVAEVSVKDSTIKNANVENCLMAKIHNWKFPAPAGGGTVEVNYPFVFKAS